MTTITVWIITAIASVATVVFLRKNLISYREFDARMRERENKGTWAMNTREED